MNDDSGTLLLGLDGVVVDTVEIGEDGVRTVIVSTAPQWVGLCPRCQHRSARSKGLVPTRPRDVKVGPGTPRLVWMKRKWLCTNISCDREVFTESVPQLPPGARITERARTEMAAAVLDDDRSVSAVAAGYGCDWNICQAAVNTATTEAEINTAQQVRAALAAIGIDENRRGRAGWHRDPTTGERVWRDKFDTVIVDAASGAGMIGQVEGRSAAAVTAWLAEQPWCWRQKVRYVCIDMSATYAKAAREALPHTQIVVDPFHVTAAANRTVDAVRRRVTRDQRGRRGRRNDREWQLRRRLLRGVENLTDQQQSDLIASLTDVDPNEEILAAWIGKELLRDVLACRDIADPHTRRRALRGRLETFYTFAAEVTVPEIHTLAATIETWQDAVIAAVTTGLSNATAEGLNRLARHVGRIGYGYRNRINQRRRIAWACTRQQRRESPGPKQLRPC